MIQLTYEEIRLVRAGSRLRLMNRPVKLLAVSLFLLVLLIGEAFWLNGLRAKIKADRVEQEKQAVAAMIHEKAVTQVGPTHFADPNSAAAQSAFRGLFSAVQSPRIFRMKVWDRESTVIWSNLAEIMGQRFPENDEVREAFDGETVLAIEEQKAEHISERQFAASAEVYVPLRDGDGPVYGVVEVYEPVLVMDRDIWNSFSSSTWPYGAATAAGLGVLAVAWWLALRRRPAVPDDAAKAARSL